MATVQLLSGAPAIDLSAGMVLRLEAIDPATGAAVAGVTVSNVVIEGEPAALDTPETLALPPLFAYGPAVEGATS